MEITGPGSRWEQLLMKQKIIICSFPPAAISAEKIGFQPTWHISTRSARKRVKRNNKFTAPYFGLRRSIPRKYPIELLDLMDHSFIIITIMHELSL